MCNTSINVPLGLIMVMSNYDENNCLGAVLIPTRLKNQTGELPAESDEFCFLRAACLAHLKGSVGLILAKASTEVEIRLGKE